MTFFNEKEKGREQVSSLNSVNIYFDILYYKQNTIHPLHPKRRFLSLVLELSDPILVFSFSK